MVYALLIEKNRPLRGLNGSGGRKCFIGWCVLLQYSCCRLAQQNVKIYDLDELLVLS